MGQYDDLIKTLEAEEKELQFVRFDSDTALELGMRFVDAARAQRVKVTIDINRNGHQLFHYACEGTSPDNDQWVIRKSRIVNRFNMSSYRMFLHLANQEKTIEERYGLTFSDYAPRGGSFPITVRQAGVIGAITVSGLPHEEDHRFLVSVLRDYLSEQRS